MKAIFVGCIISFKYILYVEKTKFISLILLSGALAVPVGAFAETAPFKQETNISQQNGKVSGIVEDALGPVAGASVVVKGLLTVALPI